MPEFLDLATVEMEYFEPLLHETFVAKVWEEPGNPFSAELELIRTAAHPLSGQEGRRTPFSLYFDAPAGVLLDQRTYMLTHPKTGELALFLVPVARKDDRLQLQAVLN